jgi:hypothetical protein
MCKSKPTPEQFAALTAYAAQHGCNWKTELSDAWMTGRYDNATVRREHDGLLQQVRNQCGPGWLRAATVLVEVAR